MRQLSLLNLAFKELERLLKSIEKDLIIWQTGCLRLIGIVKIHKIYGLQAKVGSALLELILKELGVHTVDACCYILLLNLVVVNQLLDEGLCGKSMVGIILIHEYKIFSLREYIHSWNTQTIHPFSFHAF